MMRSRIKRARLENAYSFFSCIHTDFTSLGTQKLEAFDSIGFKLLKDATALGFCSSMVGIRKVKEAQGFRFPTESNAKF